MNIQHKAAKVENNDATRSRSIPVPEIEKQKEVALLAFKEIGINDDSLSQEITNRLQVGKVPPLFHALLMPHLLPKLELVKSLHQVREGQATPNTSLVLDAEAENWRDAIDDDGKAVNKIHDSLLPSQNRWVYHKKMTKFVVELVNTEAEMLGHNVEVTTLPSMIHLVDSDKKKELLTRSQSRGIVADCFARIEEYESEVVSAITGSPGIGKSWTLLYALQQGLLYEGACVLFFQQKKKIAYLVMRRQNRLYAWRVGFGDCADSEFLEQKNVLALLDPRESKDGGANYTKPSCGFIFAASNNQNHFRGDAMKVSGDVQRYLGPPDIHELLVIARRIKSEVKEETIRNRVKQVGPLVRYVIDDALFNARKEQLNIAVENLNEENLQSVLSSKGMSGNTLPNEAITLPGTIFTIMPAKAQLVDDEEDLEEDDDEQDTQVDDGGNLKDDEEDIDDDDEEDIDDDDEEDIDDDDEENVGSRVATGYDGDIFFYGKRVVSVVCNHVLGRVACFNRKNLLSFWGLVYSADYAGVGRNVENLFWEDLKEGFQANLYTFSTEQTEEFVHNPQGVKIAEPSKKESAREALKKLFSEEPKQMIRLPPGFPVIDAAGPDRSVYQVTVSKDHEKSVSGMVDLLLHAGLLKRRGKHRRIQRQRTGKPIDLFWVVPPHRFKEWTNRKAPTYNVKRPDKVCEKMTVTEWKAFRECFIEQVHQRVLEIPENSSPTTQTQS